MSRINDPFMEPDEEPRRRNAATPSEQRERLIIVRCSVHGGEWIEGDDEYFRCYHFHEECQREVVEVVPAARLADRDREIARLRELIAKNQPPPAERIKLRHIEDRDREIGRLREAGKRLAEQVRFYDTAPIAGHTPRRKPPKETRRAALRNWERVAALDQPPTDRAAADKDDPFFSRLGAEREPDFRYGAWRRPDGSLFRAVALDVTEGPKANASGTCGDTYLTPEETIMALCDHADFHREGAFNVCDDCGASIKPEREP